MRRNFFRVFMTLLLFATFAVGQWVGYRKCADETRGALEAMATKQAAVSWEESAPAEIWDRQWKGRLNLQIGSQTFVLERYSRFDGKGREWDTAACVPAGKGMEVKGRWDPDQWWIEAHDAEHQFPSSIEVQVGESK